MKTITILVPMKLEGQAQAGKQFDSERGYAMAVLLVALSIMAVMLTVVMPVWKHAGQREKEEELVFRGKQYVHAIGLFQRKFANAYPPTIDVLVEQRFLRRKFKDPITNEDFVPILAGQSLPGSTPPGGTQGAGGRGQPGQSTQPNQPGRAGQPGQVAGQPGGRGISPIGTPGGGTTGGISGVTSKSKDTSIRLYNGRSHYNEWAFVYLPQVQAPGAGAPGTATPGQRGQPGQPGFPPGGIPGQRGRGNPNGPGGRGTPGNPPGPGGRGFGPGVTPIQPIFPPNPRGRF
jgi:type II secretory pathway pseudopilin PulG